MSGFLSFRVFHVLRLAAGKELLGEVNHGGSAVPGFGSNANMWGLPCKSGIPTPQIAGEYSAPRVFMGRKR